MARLCKFPDKECPDRYIKKRNYEKPICRLDEWKQKIGTCPYNPDIKSKNQTRINGKIDKKQTQLNKYKS